MNKRIEKYMTLVNSDNIKREILHCSRQVSIFRMFASVTVIYSLKDTPGWVMVKDGTVNNVIQ
jgi:hypothetical protein